MKINTISKRFMLNNYVNCYLVEIDASYVMVDTGMPNKRQVIEKEIENAGCHPGELKLIILTHGDLDHTGNAAYFRKKYGAKIAMHRDDVGMVEHGDMFCSRKNPNFIVKALSNQFFGLKEANRFVPDLIIEDGYDFSSFGFQAKTLHLPGHTQGSIEILTCDSDLFCGDLLGNITKPSRFSLIDDQAEAEASIKKLKKLNIKTVYPGHGKPFSMSSLTD